MAKVFPALLASVASQDLFLKKSTTTVVPNYQGCLNSSATSLPYCDVSLDIEARLDDLLSRLSIEEQVAAISPQPGLGTKCDTHTAGKEEIGLPSWMWLTETNTAIGSACYDKDKCVTTFIGPLGLGASFNRSSWRLKGDVLGTEMRALNNAGWHRLRMTEDSLLEDTFEKHLIGLTGYGPNINLVRDPRFGRNSELPGEDPFLNGHYAKEMLAGMQEQDSQGHPKMMAYLKHFTAYSRETGRGHDSYDISMHDLHESYLAAFKIAFTEGNATGAMCSYNAVNGVPSCTNDYVLNQMVRKSWGRADAHISTDCGAVNNLLGPPANATSPEEASAWAINNGTDMEMGGGIWTNSLYPAVQQGLVKPEAVTMAARRAFRVQFRAGRFDPVDSVEWTKITSDAINSTRHQQISFEAGLQSFVLLRNEELLPLKRGQKLAVVGPMGVNSNLLSDYAGDEVCYNNTALGGYILDTSCILTIADALSEANVGGETTQAKGVDVNSGDTSGVAEALELVKAADVAVLVLGNDKTQEHETHDRSDTLLPAKQESFAEQVLALGKPTVLVLSNGGALAIDTLLAGGDNFQPPSAIVEAFNPAFQARALAETLFGDYNRWGKMPVTMYPHSFVDENPMDNYDMSLAPGRTYKYYQGQPLFAFGHGLSYTTFDLSCQPSAQTVPTTITCDVRNTGSQDGDEVVFMYHSAGDDVRAQANHPVPLRALVGFERVSVAAGQTQQVIFTVAKDQVILVDENGDDRLYHGMHDLIFSRGHGQEVNISVTA